MNKSIVFLLPVCIVLIVLFASCSTLSNDTSASAKAAANLPIASQLGQTSGITLTFVRSSDANEWRESTIDFPVFEEAVALNNAIEDFISKQYQTFLDLSTANWQAFNDTEAQSPEALNAELRAPHQFMISWDFAQINQNYVSLVFKTYSYTGGANGMQTVYSINYDYKTEKLLTLQDVLQPKTTGWLTSLSAEFRLALTSQLNIAADKILKSMMMDGTAAVETNFSVFTFNEYAITFYFQKYQVAPGYFGIQSVEINR